MINRQQYECMSVQEAHATCVTRMLQQGAQPQATGTAPVGQGGHLPEGWPWETGNTLHLRRTIMLQVSAHHSQCIIIIEIIIKTKCCRCLHVPAYG